VPLEEVRAIETYTRRGTGTVRIITPTAADCDRQWIGGDLVHDRLCLARHCHDQGRNTALAGMGCRLRLRQLELLSEQVLPEYQHGRASCRQGSPGRLRSLPSLVEEVPPRLVAALRYNIVNGVVQQPRQLRNCDCGTRTPAGLRCAEAMNPTLKGRLGVAAKDQQ
jgi:hypothetical protein